MDRLYWEVYIAPQMNFKEYVEKTLSFIHIYLGEIREAVAHSEDISKFGRVVYNSNAWDTDKFTDMKDEMMLPDHYEVVKEVILRIEKYKCAKLDAGFLGRWKNPFQVADTQIPVGVTFSYEKQENAYFFRGAFFQPDWWFALQCKPLFKTDTIVQKDPDASWNMNPVGLISAKPEKVAGNRRSILNMVVDFSKEFGPKFMSLSYSQTFYNTKSNVAYIIEPNAKDNKSLHPLIVSFESGGRVVFSDSTELSLEDYKTSMVLTKKLYLDRAHFDF